MGAKRHRPMFVTLKTAAALGARQKLRAKRAIKKIEDLKEKGASS
jgi:hypothetical protein